MKRIECLKTLVPLIKDQLVVVSLGATAHEWEALCPRDGNFYNVGMGHHIPVALGLAIALPHRQVILLDTDGSVLMLLSALPVLASRPVGNLKVFVFDNEAYESAGSHPTATAGVADIAAIARGAGIQQAASVQDVDSFQAAAREALTKEGLAFFVAKIELAQADVPRKKEGHKENLLRFVRYVEATENRNILHTQHA